jgi:hypothetical protein
MAYLTIGSRVVKIAFLFITGAIEVVLQAGLRFAFIIVVESALKWFV